MTTLPVLRRAVEERYGCLATLRQFVNVTETRPDGSGRQVVVAVFNLVDSSVEIAYAWCDPDSPRGRLWLHSALHVGPVYSAETAVRESVQREAMRGEQAS